MKHDGLSRRREEGDRSCRSSADPERLLAVHQYRHHDGRFGHWQNRAFAMANDSARPSRHLPNEKIGEVVEKFDDAEWASQNVATKYHCLEAAYQFVDRAMICPAGWTC
jgi:hypothetical protein